MLAPIFVPMLIIVG
ncbi:hypothetical protein [Staphylococcus aureus]